MKTIIRLSYSILIYPLMLVLFHLLALAKADIRKALAARYQLKRRLKNYRRINQKSGTTVLLHTASMGEFEHVKPLIDQLEEQFNAEIIVTFFSPSGYEHVKQYPGVALFLYMPFDFRRTWNWFFKIAQPDFILISKHDVWPNQVWTAAKSSIPAFLVNAALAENSSRTKRGIRFFQSRIYRDLTAIFTISQEDEQRFKQYFPRCAAKMVGDTKYDQVLLRKQKTSERKILPQDWLNENPVLLLGSVWPEDLAHLLPAVKEMLIQFPQLRVIIVPHQPEEKITRYIMQEMEKTKVLPFSKIEQLKDQQVLLVDTVGILADLYKYAEMAYVGGSFRQGIHNVMEPAIYDIPVMYGPVHTNSYEAIRLLEAGGSVQLTDSVQAAKMIRRFIDNEQLRTEMGTAAGRFARKHTGGTVRIISELHNRGLS